MSDPVLEKRDNHCFISYASEDGALAQRIANWLGEAGLRIWFDQVRLGAGASVVDELARQVCNSRAFLLVATEKALTKNYVAHEVNIACDQQITQPGFTVIAVRTNPELDLSTRFPSLRKVSWMSVPECKLDVAAARRILLALAPSIPAAPETRHIYVSCGWGENEEPVTRRVCAPLVTRHVRLTTSGFMRGSFLNHRHCPGPSGCSRKDLCRPRLAREMNLRRYGGTFRFSKEHFKFHENWLHYRALVEAVAREKELYSAGAGDYAAIDATERHRLLVERVENLLANRTARFLETHKRTGENNTSD